MYGIGLNHCPCVSKGSASQRTTQLTNKPWFGRVEGTSFQMWTNQALAGHAGTLQRSFCFVRFIKSFENVEASLLVLWPMVSFVQRRFRKKAAALSTSPSSGKSHETFFFTWPRLKKELKITCFFTNPSNLHGIFDFIRSFEPYPPCRTQKSQ